MKLHLTLLIAILAASSAHIGGRLPISQGLDPQLYCARKLARMLVSVCDSGEKSSGSGSMLYPILAPYYRAQQQYMASQKLKNQEPLYDSPYKMDSQSEWPPQKSEAQYAWPYKTETYGSLSHKTKESEDWPLHKTKESQDWPWLTSNKNRISDLPSRNKWNMVEECCYKPCTADELMNFC